MIFAYFSGLITLPLLALAYQFALWGFGKDSGLSECSIPGCKRGAWESGQHFNLTVWVQSRWHEWVTNRPGTEHRSHVMDFWRTKRDKGFPIHPRVRKWLDRQEQRK